MNGRQAGWLAVAAATLIGCSSCSPSRSAPPESASASLDRTTTLTLRRQPGGIYWPGQPMNFWNLEVRSDGLAALAAEGTPLIADGDYSGLIAVDSVSQLRDQVDRLRSVDRPISICMHADDFQVIGIPGQFFRNACISDVDKSDLSSLYIAAQSLIKTVSWKYVRPRPPRA